MTDSGTYLQVSIWRGSSEGRFQDYAVPARANQTILDVVTWVQRHREPSLAYRFACRVGVCGSCAMTVNGRPRWTCRTHVRKVAGDARLTIEPLRNLPVIKDLACDMTAFFDKWQRAGGRFKGAAGRGDPIPPIDASSLDRRAADAAIECINCAVCYSACDSVAWNPDYVGPAALNRAWTLVNDVRHVEQARIADSVGAAGGCLACHTHGSCAEFCPLELNPTASIAGLKRLTLRRALTGGGP